MTWTSLDWRIGSGGLAHQTSLRQGVRLGQIFYMMSLESSVWAESSAVLLFSIWTDELKCCFLTFCLPANPWPDPFHTNCSCQDPHLTFTLMWRPSNPWDPLSLWILSPSKPFMDIVAWHFLRFSCTFPYLTMLLFFLGEVYFLFFLLRIWHISSEKCWVKSSVSVVFRVCQDNPQLHRSLQMFLTPWWLFTARKPLGDPSVSRLVSQTLSQAHYSAAWRFSFIALYYRWLINHLNPSLVSNSKRKETRVVVSVSLLSIFLLN